MSVSVRFIRFVYEGSAGWCPHLNRERCTLSSRESILVNIIEARLRIFPTLVFIYLIQKQDKDLALNSHLLTINNVDNNSV